MKKFTTKLLSAILLAPIAAIWIRHQEKRILKQGSPLDAEQLGWAKKLGILRPEKIRLIREKELSFPAPKWLTRFFEKRNMSLSTPAGMSLRYGIFICSKIHLTPRLLCHELTHTLQYERLGSIYQFARAYLFECIYYGYPNAPMEKEADLHPAATLDNICN